LALHGGVNRGIHFRDLQLKVFYEAGSSRIMVER
jgi:hypothetical protein